MMKFRQRMGWLGLALYLLLSALAVYYIFEVNTLHFERVQRGVVDLSAPPPAAAPWSLLTTLPVWMWALLFLLPYVQLFLFLFSCTRADPRAVGYCVLPVCIALLCTRHHHHPRPPANHRPGSVIDT